MTRSALLTAMGLRTVVERILRRVTINPSSSRNRLGIPSLIVALALAFIPTWGSAAPGALDRTFAGDGTTTRSVGTTDYGRAAAIQPDGKIVMAGVTHNGSTYDIAVTRFHRDGSPDTGFGTGGVAKPNPTSSEEQVSDIAVQPDGKIVIAGYAWNGFNWDTVVIRLDPDGSPDEPFGGANNDGLFESTAQRADRHDTANAVAIQRDGKILVTGYVLNTDRDLTILRLTSAGIPDSSFDGDGYVDADWPGDGTVEQGTGIAVQRDGKIVVGGRVDTGGAASANFIAARFLAGGGPDDDFDGDGKTVTDVASNDSAVDVAIQSDGKIVLGGSTNLGGSAGEDAAVVRYRPNGTPDPTFDDDGKVTADLGSTSDHVYALAIQNDRRVVLAGYRYDPITFGTDVTVARLSPSGELDDSFSGDGRAVTAPSPNEDYAADVDVIGGKILAVGTADLVPRDFFLARYLGRSGRKTSLQAKPRSPLENRRFRLLGEVSSPDPLCERRVVVTISRDPAGAPRRFRVLKRVTTNVDGEFTYRRRADRTARYRASLRANDSCASASRTISVQPVAS